MKSSRILSTIGMFMMILAVLISIIDFMCFSRWFYVYEYSKSNTAETIGMSEDDLYDTTAVLLDYLQDKRDDLSVQKEISGNVREVFDSREKMHMEEVKSLYQNAMTVRNICFFGSIAVLTAVFFMNRGKSFKLFKRGYRNASILMGALLGFIAIWALSDFDQFWIQFHYLFFDNDLFFLDPNTEILINMVPDTFFFDLVFCIILIFVFILLLIALFFLRYERRRVDA